MARDPSRRESDAVEAGTVSIDEVYAEQAHEAAQEMLPGDDATVPAHSRGVPPPDAAPTPPEPEPEPTIAEAPSPWRRRIRRIALGALLLAALGVLGAGGTVLFYSRNLPAWETLREYDPKQTTRVLGADGSLVGEIFEERRTVVPSEDIPAVLVQALISAEDANFFQHSGVDWVGTLKAAVGNLRPGTRARGASTITQQTVKTFLLSNERRLSRKIKEAILAMRLEKNLSKQDILYLYLNQIYFGHRRYGIEEASRYYFGHSARDLNLFEAALLASIPKSPNEINPRSNPRRAKERQTYVLEQMAKNGYISKEVAAREIARPVVLPPVPSRETGGYYAEEVRRLLVEQLARELGTSVEEAEQKMTTGGLQVETYMVPALQAAAETAVRDGLRDLDKRMGWRGALGKVDAARWSRLLAVARARDDAESPKDRLVDARRLDAKEVSAADDTGLRLLAAGIVWREREVGREVVARVEQAGKQAAIVDLGSARATLRLESLQWARPWNPAAYTPAPRAASDVVGEGDLVLVRVVRLNDCKGAKKACEEVEIALEQDPVVEGALAAIDPDTRGTVALVGGYDVRRSAFNRATQARRQPGSAFKPFVYATALEQGQARALLAQDPTVDAKAKTRCTAFTPRSIVYDTPELIRDRWTGKPWQPRNFERDFFAGPMTLRKALAESKNTVAVKLVAEIGCEPLEELSYEDAQVRGLAKVKETARRAGVDSPIPDSITAALGSGEVVPLELTNAYATFAMLGRWAPPQLIRRVRSPSGETLLDNRPVFEQQPIPPPGQPAPPAEGRGLRPDVAYVTADLLRSVVEDPEGTARSMQKLGRTVYGKTGTASDHRDAWFVGFTPELVAGVWTGFDNHDEMGPRETGSHAAGPIWLHFMQAAEAELPRDAFDPPAGVATLLVDPRSGLIADVYSPYVEREVYLSGTEPTEAAPPPGLAKPEDFLRGEGP